MVTQNDVAERAQVSFITVSRVINNKGNVREETRERVLKAIAELNYYPNTCGRGLHYNKVNTIGVVIATSFDVNIHETYYYNELMIGIEKSCITNSCDMLISMLKESPGQEFDYLKLYYERKVDGLIMVSPNLSELQLKAIIKQNIPCVVIGERFTKYKITYVDSDNRVGIFKVGEYLVQKGHRKIAFLKGMGSHGHAIDRLNGFHDLINKYKLDIPEHWILDGDFSVECGRKALQTLLAGGEMPTVIICSNDTMALGVLSEAKEAGVAVPDDLSIIGFDGVNTCKFTHPTLTSIRQPLVEMGKAAADILFQKLEDPDLPQQIKIHPVELLPGGSLKECNTPVKL
jgi:LacI family transcriptional regulator